MKTPEQLKQFFKERNGDYLVYKKRLIEEAMNLNINRLTELHLRTGESSIRIIDFADPSHSNSIEMGYCASAEEIYLEFVSRGYSTFTLNSHHEPTKFFLKLF